MATHTQVPEEGVQLVDTDDMMDEMSEIVDGSRRTSACRIGAITGLVLVFIGAVLVASKIGFMMGSPKTTSSTNAVIGDYTRGGPCWVASQNWEGKVGYTDCSKYREPKVEDWPNHIITHYPDPDVRSSDGSRVMGLSQRLIWQADPEKMCTASYEKTGGKCRMGNKKTDTGLECEGIKNDEDCPNPSDCVSYSIFNNGCPCEARVRWQFLFVETRRAHPHEKKWPPTFRGSGAVATFFLNRSCKPSSSESAAAFVGKKTIHKL